MMPHNQILRKCAGDYKFAKSQEKIDHLKYIDEVKLFAKNEKELETNTNNKNIQPGCRNRICHRKNDEKRKKTNKRKNNTAQSKKSQNVRNKGHLQVVENNRSGRHQTSGDKRKKLKNVSLMNEKTP